MPNQMNHLQDTHIISQIAVNMGISCISVVCDDGNWGRRMQITTSPEGSLWCAAKGRLSDMEHFPVQVALSQHDH